MSRNPEVSSTFYSSFQSIRAELESLTPEQLVAINIDVHGAVQTALGCMPELAGHRDAIRARFGAEWVEHLDKLEVYAQAAVQAHGEFLGAQTSSAELQELSRQLVEIRDILVTDATSLVKRKVIDPQALAGLRGTVGFRNQVLDVIQLTAMFRRNWGAVREITPVKIEDLERAETLTTELTRAAGIREQGAASSTSVAEMRQRAFTLFVRTYDELRRAMSFLRWHEGDVDEIIPSLYAGRGGRGKRVEDEPTEPTPVVLEPTPVSDDAEDKPPARPNVGMPGSDPFVS